MVKNNYIHFDTDIQAQNYLLTKGYDPEYYTVRYRELPYRGYYIWSWKKLEFLKYDYDIGGKINGKD